MTIEVAQSFDLEFPRFESLCRTERFVVEHSDSTHLHVLE
jgi:hypothetical protein